MAEVIVHQNEELSCPTKDLLVWPWYDLTISRARSAFECFFPAYSKRLLFCYNTTAYLCYFTSESLGGKTIPGRQG